MRLHPQGMSITVVDPSDLNEEQKQAIEALDEPRIGSRRVRQGIWYERLGECVRARVPFAVIAEASGQAPGALLAELRRACVRGECSAADLDAITGRRTSEPGIESLAPAVEHAASEPPTESAPAVEGQPFESEAAAAEPPAQTTEPDPPSDPEPAAVTTDPTPPAPPEPATDPELVAEEEPASTGPAADDATAESASAAVSEPEAAESAPEEPAPSASAPGEDASTGATESASAGKRTMSAEHRAAIAAGRIEAAAVRAYLDAIDAHRPRRGRARSPERIAERKAAVDAELDAGVRKVLKRLELMQERRSLTDALVRIETAPNLDEAEARFVEHAAAFSERKGITYMTWREFGVSVEVLAKAGITRK